MSRRQKWVLWPIAALVALVGVVVLVFDWNWLKGPVEDAASGALDREVTIAGDLDVDLSLTPTITLEQVQIANAEWGSRPDMLTIPQVAFAVDLGALLRGQVELPFLRVREPDLLLETNPAGEGNWQFGPPDEPPSAPAIPTIEDLEIADAAIRYHEPGPPPDLVATLATVEGALTGAGIQLSADGTLNDEPLSLSLEGAPVDQLDAPAERFPFELDARLGASHLTATGSADQPLQAQGLDVEVALDSAQPESLLALVGRGQRDLGELDLSFSLSRPNQTWTVRQIDLELGESDLSGEISFDGQGERPAITADLHSNQVRLAAIKDLVALATRGAGGAAQEPTVEAALADAEAALEDQAQDEGSLADQLNLSPAMLPAIDAEVRYTVDHLSGPELALRDLALDGRLEDRLPHLSLSGNGQYKDEPVTIDVRVGDPASDSEGDAYAIHADLAAAGTQADLDGSLSRPAEFAGLNLRFDVASRDLDQLLAVVGVDVPQIPPFDVSGRLAQDGSSWQFTELDGRLGESDVQGQVTVDLQAPEPVITADLRSDQVRLQDVQELVPEGGAAPGDGEAGLDAAIAAAKAALAQDQESAFGLHPDTLPKIDADVSYTVDRLTGPELALTDLDLEARLTEGLPRLELTGGGEYRGTPVALDVQLGRAEPAGSDAPYPVVARLEVAATQLRVEGVIGQPATLDGLDLEVEATSEDINEVLALAGLDLPQIPPFAIDGHVVQDGQVWRLDDFSAEFSESDLAGQLTVDLSEQRPFIAADLQSNRLLMSDLIAVREKAAAVEEQVDVAPEAEPAEEPGLPLIVDGDLNLEALPAIDVDFELRAGQVELPDAEFDRLHLDLQLRDQVPVIEVSGEGRFRQQPMSLEARVGTEETFENPDARYPLEVALESEATSLSLDGSVDSPRGFTGLDVDAVLAGQDLAVLGRILQLPLPRTPPYQLAGKVTHQADLQRWNLVALHGEVGDSDLSGDVSFELSTERPTLVADLHSDSLDFDDLGVMVGAPTGTSDEDTASVAQQREAAAAAADRYVLPDQPFAVPELRTIDARVEYDADAIQARRLPLESVHLELTLQDGTLAFQPLRFPLAGGELEAVAVLHSQANVLDGDIDLTLRNIKLNQLFRHFDIEIADIELEEEGAGTFGGQARLEAQGRSIRELAASAHGDISVIMDGGQINALIVEAIGLDVGEALSLLISEGDEEQSTMVPLECLVGQFAVENGVMQTEALVLKTVDSTITGSGQVDLGEERLALELLAHPQDASALTASTPVRIEGTFKNPEIDLVSEELQEKSLAALALGVVLPVVGAILPFIETGEEDEGLSCAALIRNAEESADVPGDVSSDGAE